MWILQMRELKGGPQQHFYKSGDILGWPWKLVTIVRKLGYFTYLGNLQPTYIGVII